MNDQDLERALRAQRGPREEGYVAADLPDSLDGSPMSTGPRLGLRAVLILPAALAGVLAVAIVGGMLSGGSPFGTEPGPSSSTSTLPSVAPSSLSPGPAECAVDDVAVSAMTWGGAAGSRGTVATLSLAEGRDPCVMPVTLTGRITDAKGALLVSSTPTPSVPDLILEAGIEYRIGLSWSNWCAGPVDLPILVYVGPWRVPVTHVIAAIPGATANLEGDVPTCLGENVPTSMSLTELQPKE